MNYEIITFSSGHCFIDFNKIKDQGTRSTYYEIYATLGIKDMDKESVSTLKSIIDYSLNISKLPNNTITAAMLALKEKIGQQSLDKFLESI
jgi:hypothetical protein